MGLSGHPLAASHRPRAAPPRRFDRSRRHECDVHAEGGGHHRISVRAGTPQMLAPDAPVPEIGPAALGGIVPDGTAAITHRILLICAGVRSVSSLTAMLEESECARHKRAHVPGNPICCGTASFTGLGSSSCPVNLIFLRLSTSPWLSWLNLACLSSTKWCFVS